MNTHGLVAELLGRCAFPDPGDATLHCAVSGGADSLALLALARHFAPSVRLMAWHVDHGLRPGSSAEAAMVRKYTDDVGVDLTSVRVHIEPGPNLEARARAERYAALPRGVCTGHTADDVAETVLANLMRGCGVDGLSPLRSATVNRPLLGLRRTETAALCAALGWVPIEDPMNADRRFLRTRVRHEVMPLLEDVASRDVAGLLARGAALMVDDIELLDSLADALDPSDARVLRDAHPALARRAIRRWLTVSAVDADGHPPSLAVVERVLAVARGEAVACELGRGWRVARSQQRLRLVGPDDRLVSVDQPT